MESGDKGYLYELFSSIQGEGLWTGCLHHFFRLAGCATGCIYCDTPLARERTEGFLVNGEAAGRNPVTPREAADLVAALDGRVPGARALAVTGGEPLEQVGFLASFLPRVRSQVMEKRPVLLETNGLHPEAMARIAGQVDMVSMDLKLKASSGLRDPWPLHERFLKSLEGVRFYVKVVVNQVTPCAEVSKAAQIVARADPSAPFFLQPESRGGRVQGGAYLTELYLAGRESIPNVRIQPQVHRMLNLQ